MFEGRVLSSDTEKKKSISITALNTDGILRRLHPAWSHDALSKNTLNYTSLLITDAIFSHRHSQVPWDLLESESRFLGEFLESKFLKLKGKRKT